MNDPSADTPTPTCPLSGASDVSLLARVSSVDIARLYQEFFALDIMPLFEGVEELQMWRSDVSDLVFPDPPLMGDAAFYEALIQRLSDGSHRRWFCKNLINHALMRFVGVATGGPVKTHPLWFKFQRLSNVLASILWGFTDPVPEPRDHTGIGMMRKPA